MKLAGFFLLVAGWCIVLCAIVLFARALPRYGFVIAGMGLEAFGLTLVFRGDSRGVREVE